MHPFGERLKIAFDHASQAEIARKMRVSEAAVTNYLEGRIPRAEKLIQIRDLTTCNLDWLLTGIGKPFLRVEAVMNEDDESAAKELYEKWKILEDNQGKTYADFLGYLVEAATLRTDYEDAEGIIQQDFGSERYQMSTAFVLEQSVLAVVLSSPKVRDFIRALLKNELAGNEISPFESADLMIARDLGTANDEEDGKRRKTK